CGKRMEADAPDPDDRPSFEHILPRKQGGGNRPCNLAVACRRCNVDRAHKLGWCRGKPRP
ncbi:HNH endonuclease, partial [Roseomonas gilardii]